METLKRILTVQDISCVGKCSLTVALPVISALGVECAVLPTAVLSTHTGGLGKPLICDLTGELDSILAHWRTLGIRFDAIYSGYLASEEQIDTMLYLADAFRADGAPLIVDPVMADGGKLYSGFGSAFVRKMRRLCASASLVLPNITEAALLTDSEYRADGDADEGYVGALIDALCALGAQSAVVTGAARGGDVGAASLDGRTGLRFSHFAPRVSRSFHGTGDLFSSVVTAALVRGRTLGEALTTAVDFTADCMRASLDLPSDRLYGVAFERRLGALARIGESWNAGE